MQPLVAFGFREASYTRKHLLIFSSARMEMPSQNVWTTFIRAIQRKWIPGCTEPNWNLSRRTLGSDGRDSAGEIWWADHPEPRRSEPGYRRPVLVVQADSFNLSPIHTAIVATITSNVELADAPGNVLLPARSASLETRSSTSPNSWPSTAHFWPSTPAHYHRAFSAPSMKVCVPSCNS